MKGYWAGLLVVLLSACGGTEQPASPEEAGKTPEQVAEANASAEGNAKKEKEAAEKKVEKPKVEPENRKSLKLLAVRGGAISKGIRSERSGIYQEFRVLQDEHKKAVAKLVDSLQYFQWSPDPEALKKAPAEILGYIDEALKIGAAHKERGEASHAKLTEWEKEIESGKKRHREKKVQALKDQRNSEMKVYRTLNILIRSLLDEALIYGQYGSWEMQDAMKADYLQRKESLKADGPMENSLDTLFMALGVPKAER